MTQEDRVHIRAFVDGMYEQIVVQGPPEDAVVKSLQAFVHIGYRDHVTYADGVLTGLTRRSNRFMFGAIVSADEDLDYQSEAPQIQRAVETVSTAVTRIGAKSAVGAGSCLVSGVNLDMATLSGLLRAACADEGLDSSRAGAFVLATPDDPLDLDVEPFEGPFGIGVHVIAAWLKRPEIFDRFDFLRSSGYGNPDADVVEVVHASLNESRFNLDVRDAWTEGDLDAVLTYGLSLLSLEAPVVFQRFSAYRAPNWPRF